MFQSDNVIQILKVGIDADWALKSIRAVDGHCFEEAKKFEADEEGTNKTCNMIGFRYASCVFKKVAVLCPKDQWIESHNCDKVAQIIGRS